MFALQIKELSKVYRLDRNRSLGLCDRIRRALGIQRSAVTKDWFWALQDISFNVQAGESIGIIGRNGAGKSTLLKILSRVTAPSKGCAVVSGRISSVLEIGTGFHPELSGRENIYLNGAILGMQRTEIRKKVDAIIAFAELEDFIDVPVKRYSSGMYVRLAFSVVAHLDADILLVDEVLAVGDHEFQKKCLVRAQEVSKWGKTVLFVSHNMGAISRICEKTLLMDKGRLIKMGNTADVIRSYLESGVQGNHEYIPEPKPKQPIFLRSFRIERSNGKGTTDIPYEEPFHFVIDYTVTRSVRHVSVGIGIGTHDYIPVLASADFDAHPSLLSERVPGNYQAVVEIPGAWLNSGQYSAAIYISNIQSKEIFEKAEALSFSILETNVPGAVQGVKYRRGILQPILNWQVASSTS